jgi:hypothetical protein
MQRLRPAMIKQDQRPISIDAPSLSAATRVDWHAGFRS